MIFKVLVLSIPHRDDERSAGKILKTKIVAIYEVKFYQKCNNLSEIFEVALYNS